MFGTAGVLELLAQRERIDAALLGAVGALDTSDECAADGALSTHSWLVDRGRVTRPEASRLLRGGRLVQRYPRTAKRLADGDVTCAHVDALAVAARGHDELFDDHEEQLLEIASETRPEQFRVAMRRWREIADDLDDNGARDPEKPYRRRRLYLSKLPDGSVHIDGRLDPVAGEALISALERLMDPDPERTPAQRRADALHELARRALGSAVPADLTVFVDVETLAGMMPDDPRTARCDLAHLGPVAPSTVRRLACDAILRRVVRDGDGEILDLGRTTRIVTKAQRTAVALRDGGCSWPGCDRPPEWCDVHHDQHWIDGGPTDLENLKMYCRHHHVKLHEGWTIHPRPDGTVDVEPP